MTIETIDTLVVGGGQAGLAASEHLGNNAVPHLVLERSRIAERWRTARWDGLVANGPAWHDRFPSREFATGPDEFPGKEAVTRYFEDFAKQINAPIRCGVDVQRVEKRLGQSGFHVTTSEGQLNATNIICATGPFQKPLMPPIVPPQAPVQQIHSNTYFNPEQLPPGAVLVVGSGSSGAQIADELLRSGREVYLSVGPHDRPPRSYRNREFVWWLGVLGKWDDAAADPDTAHVTIAVSGARGGKTVDFREYAERGMKLLGMTESYQEGVLRFMPDLAKNIEQGDASYLGMLDEADAYVARNGLDLPPEPQARQLLDDPECVRNPQLELDLQSAKVASIIWATGYALEFDWLDLDVFDDEGKPVHQRGVSNEPGIYFLGLPWLSRRGSSFIWGVWHDAKFLADHINTQRRYLDYHRTSM